MENFYEIFPIVTNSVMQEKPVSILEISGYNNCYGKLFAECQRRLNINNAKIDRVDLFGDAKEFDNQVYTEIFSAEILNDIESISRYDFIFIAHLFENIPPQNAFALLDRLQRKVDKQIFVITPEYPNDLENPGKKSSVRQYHPIAFLGFDFSYVMHNSFEGDKWQIYSVFGKNKYPELPADNLPQHTEKTDKMRIAYVLPLGKNLTGGLKALLHQMRQMTRRGHIVKAYLRTDEENARVIPNWSELTDDDVAQQIIVPRHVSYSEVITDVDVIVLSWMELAAEFAHSEIPVVLWEQGYEVLYGDYGRLLTSDSETLKKLRYIYRLPIHLVAVSDTIKRALKGKYNRHAELIPPCIDTEFYRPCEQKSNAMPTILLVGHPGLIFKGFAFALSVLESAWALGARFSVQWACQRKPSGISTSFPIEYFEMASQEQLASLYRKADVFLSASLYESFPLPPIEAMASGTAVIATDSGGIRTYAEPGKNCLLAEQGDVDSCATALIFLLTQPEFRNALAAAGRETAMKYSAEKTAELWEKYLLRILEAKRGERID